MYGCRILFALCLFFVLSHPGIEPCSGEQDFDRVEVRTEKIAEGVFFLTGSGGNIGLSAGEDGVLMIDDQFAPLTDKILAAVAEISDKPVRFVINTHWHQDHTGGNKNLAEGGAVIVAHENVRKRLSTEQFLEFFDRKIPPSPKAALPVITFTENITFHCNNDEIHAFYISGAHTDGDTVVLFRKANAIHMGDIYFEGMYPFIDLSAGGSIDGMIAAVDRVLPMIDANTKVIPGHGPLSDKAKLEAHRDMLSTVRDRIGQRIKEGKTLEEILESKPTEDYDAALGQGFLKPEQFIEIVYKSLTSEKAEKTE